MVNDNVSDARMHIGEAATVTGFSRKMIRHYEAIGLISPSPRTDGGYRTYTVADLNMLKFIKSAKTLGFSLEQTKQLLSLWQDKTRASADVKMLALAHIEELTAKINELTVMRDQLQELAERCHGDRRPDCPIIAGLTNR